MYISCVPGSRKCISGTQRAHCTSTHSTSAYVSTRQHTSAYVSIRQHTSAYVRYLDVNPLITPAFRLLQGTPLRRA